jgi:hypothetical protein
MKVLELGSYVSVAYAGMLLAEQGHQVDKWISPTTPDPILGLKHGRELWAWINHGKTVTPRHARDVDRVTGYDVVIDNVRAVTWARWGVDPARLAASLSVPWVSLRDEFDRRSFDAVAQARAWMDHAGYVPFYIGDTAAGLWLAFKASNAGPGHHVVRQASLLAKLVEGELTLPVERGAGHPPWDEPGTYGADADGASVLFRGERVTEPVRDHAWRWQHLDHLDGRIRV